MRVRQLGNAQTCMPKLTVGREIAAQCHRQLWEQVEQFVARRLGESIKSQWAGMETLRRGTACEYDLMIFKHEMEAGDIFTALHDACPCTGEFGEMDCTDKGFFAVDVQEHAVLPGDD